MYMVVCEDPASITIPYCKNNDSFRDSSLYFTLFAEPFALALCVGLHQRSHLVFFLQLCVKDGQREDAEGEQDGQQQGRHGNQAHCEVLATRPRHAGGLINCIGYTLHLMSLSVRDKDWTVESEENAHN